MNKCGRERGDTSQGGFAMVHMGDHGHVPNVIDLVHLLTHLLDCKARL